MHVQLQFLIQVTVLVDNEDDIPDRADCVKAYLDQSLEILDTHTPYTERESVVVGPTVLK